MKALPRGVEGSEATRRAAARVLAAVGSLAGEIHTRPGRCPDLGLDSSLERHAGLDSVARMELLSRLETEFGQSYPERAVAGRDIAANQLQSTANQTKKVFAEENTDRHQRAKMHRNVKGEPLVRPLDKIRHKNEVS